MTVYAKRPDASARLKQLLDILKSLPHEQSCAAVSVRSLMDKTDIRKSTLYRELKFLNELGLIVWDRGIGVRRATSDTLLPPVGLTPSEAVALGLITPLLENRGLDDAIHAIQKIVMVLPDALKPLVTASQEAVLPAPRKGNQAPEATLVAIINAIRQRRTLSLYYDSASSGLYWRRFDPYGMDLGGTKIALQGWCHRKSQFIVLLLHRVHDFQVTVSVFPRREAQWQAFRGERGVVYGLRGGPPTEVRVRFSSVVTRYVNEAPWAESLQRIPIDNGGILLTGTVMGVEGILNELLRWRRHAIVEGGVALKQAYLEELQAMWENHTPDPPVPQERES